MKFIEQRIEGVFLIEPQIYEDERGVFRRHFCQKEMSNAKISFSVKQGNISENPHLHTLRGFHYQEAPAVEDKILSCLTGAIHDIVLDLRPHSKTYLQWVAVQINSINRFSLYVPGGCANAFLTLQSQTIIHYYMGEYFTPNAYCGIRYNDPAFHFKWPFPPKVISEKDLQHPDFSPQKSP